ncbi:redoxin family protein [Leptobacterium flavescens]|uniref:Redoxin family protein n=1 Tax=Leptobacterium flavescens TaxID=472055 RepID=A0A6P0UK68_9FLAO|nr:TlpA disulfide reductase family protein [Leptobacterium flavescens]NER13357.1 redoxin family protein [Leptobacterium flavescens]
MRILILSLIAVFIISCKSEVKEVSLNTGKWRGIMVVQDEKELPFNFEVIEGNKLKIFNAEEVIEVDEISLKGDSILIKVPVFEGYISGTYTATSIDAEFIKPSLDRIVPFHAEFSDADRFSVENTAAGDISGNWEAVFSPDVEEDRYIAKGIFEQKGNIVTGTFRTTTGDYRYLEGVLDGDELKLSTFDGSHAFLFTAKVTDSTMTGTFYSGNHFQEPFVAKKNEFYELPDADSLTFIKEGYEKLAFSFPDLDGNTVSLTDDRFKDKVVVVQILGSWCPNCLDETKYYVDYHKNLKKDDVEFVGLAFEYAKTEEKAFNSIRRLKERIGVPYPILLAQFGTSDKDKAQEKLPMLNHVLSYPTSIFIDKKGKVRKIHTGFNGPATGEKYIEFKKGFEAFIEMLRSE